MAASRWKSTLYPSEQFVEACGAVVFDTSTDPKRVLLLYEGACDEWLLPKGRRNCNESRKEAAIREVREESGCAIQLRPITMNTRAPSELEAADVKDEPRAYDSLTEPFMLDVRDLGNSKGVKLVWWFVAELGGVQGDGEAQFRPEFVQCDRAVEQLTFQKDREVLGKALEIMERSTNASA
ncbi:NUDIX domain-containing protein [Hypoxylon rubiginosum]|uniref:NUDIX domain-containing protein n=1 Tax=Hypoxylon rubiginosum TaxID=110542 RepID=A0ACB9YQX4_9PEZI|nr:NUDIX domain-containing protein [Hypoxylon rubiginosum]